MTDKIKTEIPIHLKQFFKTLKDRRGKISTVRYEKEIKPKKKFIDLVDGPIVKKSRFQVRAGVEYDQLKLVKEKHESGERKRKGLPDSMEKVDTGVYLNKNTKSWKVGCAPINNEHSIREGWFEIDGKRVELDEAVTNEGHTLRDILYAGDMKTENSGDWMMLTVENIKAFSGI